MFECNNYELWIQWVFLFAHNMYYNTAAQILGTR